MAAEDEIWRPGYEGPPPVSGATSFDRVSPPINEREPATHSPRRLMAILSVVAAVVLASVVVVGWSLAERSPEGSVDVAPTLVVVDDDRLQFSRSDEADLTDGEPLRLLESPTTPFAGADQRRFPTDLVSQWRIELAPLVADGGQNATTWVEAVDNRFVVVGIGDARALSGPSAIHVIDASSGAQLWSTQLDTRIDNAEFIAAIDDVLVLAISSEVVAFDLPTGAEVWRLRLAKVDEQVERLERLEGTDLLAVTSPGNDDRIGLIEPRSGAAIGEMVGDLLGTDRQGRWYVLRGGKILEFDLSDASIDVSGMPADGELVGTVDAARSGEVAVIGDSLVATVDEMLSVGPLATGGERITDSGGLTPLNIDFGTPQWLVLVRGIVPLGGAAFATVGGGTVSGAEVVDGSIRFAWQRRGVITMSFATERGVVLLLATDGGAAQSLVDGATGNTIEPLTMAPGLFDALDVVGNGMIARRTSREGPRLAGLDLDGNELWAFDVSSSVAVGDGIVVTSTPQPNGSFVVDAFGDVE